MAEHQSRPLESAYRCGEGCGLGVGVGEGAACRSVGGRWRDIMWSPNAGHVSSLYVQINSYHKVHEVNARVRIDIPTVGQIKYSSLDVRDADIS